MKNNQKGFVIPLIIAIIAILVIGGVLFVKSRSNNFPCWPPFCMPGRPALDATNTNPIIGGDKDEHGCLGPAGYSWCAVKNKCLRVWEEKCEVATTTVPVSTTTNPVICTADAKMCPDGSYVGRTGPKCEFAPCSRSCKTDQDCMELFCVDGGFAHELCVQSKCTISAEVKKQCSGLGQ